MQGFLHKTVGGRFDFEKLSGEVTENIINEVEAPTEQLLAVELDGNHLVSFDVIGHRMLGQREKRVALVRVVRSEDQVESAWEAIKTLAEYVETYTRQVNRIWDVVEVTPFVVIDTDQPMGLNFNFGTPNVQAQLAEQDPNYERHNYWGGVGGGGSGLQGIAWTGSWKFWTFMTMGGRVTVHELWHCFGLEHSWSGNDAYGGRDFQGKHPSTHNAAALMYLGQIQDHEIHDLDEGTSFLIPVECGSTDARPGEYRAVRVIRDNKICIVSVHKDDHQSAYGKGKLIDGALWVHTYDPANRPSYRTTMIGRFMDTPIELPNGATVSVTGRKNGVVRIAVDSEQRPEFPEWPEVPGDTYPISENTAGIWYSPEYTYQGIRLHVEGTHVQGYWFTHLPEGGRVWLVLDGHINEGIVKLNVIRTDGRSQRSDGEARLVMTGPDRGLFKVRCKTFGIDHFYLERLSFMGEDHPLTGLFETGSLEGFSSVYIDGEIHAYFFSYNALGHPDWSIYTGPMDDLDIYKPESLYKGFYGSDGISGHATATISEIDNITLKTKLMK